MKWSVQFRVFRSKGEAQGYDEFRVEVSPQDSVLDALEKIWAHQDRTLTFRHACHHASCGSCGLRLNGVEKLPCVTAIQEVAVDGGKVVCEPLRHFPVVSDLVVDFGLFFGRLENLKFAIIRAGEPIGGASVEADAQGVMRFENCIECGLCVSACPIAGTDEAYLGPAALAAAWRMIQEPRGVDPLEIIRKIDHEHGCWRCHVAFECSEVCPSNVDPGALIMALRAEAMKRRWLELVSDLKRRIPWIDR